MHTTRVGLFRPEPTLENYNALKALFIMYLNQTENVLSLFLTIFIGKIKKRWLPVANNITDASIEIPTIDKT